MAATTEYLVLPRTPKVRPTPTATRVVLSSYERSNVRGLHGGLGFVIWLGVYLLGGLVTSSAIREGTALFGIGMASSVLAATIAVVMVARMTKAANVAAREREKAQDERRQVECANEADARLAAQQAATLTAVVVAIYEQAVAASLQLPQSLESASGWLRRAESEYHDNAFGPFWDCVESAAANLSAFNDGTRVLSQRANAYYSQLNGRQHSFPVFAVDIRSLPDSASVLTRFRTVVRMGQTNFQFANIWEHRRTREVLIAGFRTLGDAINNLETTLDASIQDLRGSVSTGLAAVVTEEIRTRDTLDRRMREQNRMLDNIQHSRRPSPSDSPSTL